MNYEDNTKSLTLNTNDVTNSVHQYYFNTHNDCITKNQQTIVATSSSLPHLRHRNNLTLLYEKEWHKCAAHTSILTKQINCSNLTNKNQSPYC